MTFPWLDMRINEERDRRQRESNILERLPAGLDELHRSLSACIEAYTQAFGPESADIQLLHGRIRVTVRDEQAGRWEQRAKIEITGLATLPGFKIERGGEPYLVEVGLLPGDKMFYRDGDEYIALEELTRRILDRSLFPKLAAE